MLHFRAARDLPVQVGPSVPRHTAQAGFADIDIREAVGRIDDKDWLHVMATA